MVGVASGSLQADSQPGSFGLVWGSAAAWRRFIFIIWTGWTLTLALSYDDSTINIIMVIIIVVVVVIIIIIILLQEAWETLSLPLLIITYVFVWQQIFRPPRSTYDVVIELNTSQLAREYCSVDAQPSVVPKFAAYTEPKLPGKQPWPVIGYEPMQCYLRELRVSSVSETNLDRLFLTSHFGQHQCFVA